MNEGIINNMNDSRNMYNRCYYRCINMRMTVVRIRSSWFDIQRWLTTRSPLSWDEKKAHDLIFEDDSW